MLIKKSKLALVGLLSFSIAASILTSCGNTEDKKADSSIKDSTAPAKTDTTKSAKDSTKAGMDTAATRPIKNPS